MRWSILSLSGLLGLFLLSGSAASAPGASHAAIGAQAAPPGTGLVLADASACAKPRLAAPPRLKESHARYNIRRRYIDLDGSGTCVLMEFWVERLSGSDSPGMRTLGHRFLRATGKKWAAFETALQLFPYLLRAPGGGQAYLVVAPDYDMDSISAGGVQPEVYVRGGWQTGEPGWVDRYVLLPAGRERGHILRTLAGQLAQRTAPEKQTHGERKRIRALLFAAAEADKTGAAAPLP